MEPRVEAEERNRMIAEAAYFRAERRGFAGGDPVADWVEAEAEVDAALGAVHEPLQSEPLQSEPLQAQAEPLRAQGEPLQVQSAALYAHRPEPSRAGEARARQSEPEGQQYDELLARIEDGVAEAAKKVDALRKKAGDAETAVRAEVQQQLDRITELRDALETRRNEIRQQGAQASRSVLEQAESLWNELTAFLSRKAPVTRKRSSRRK